MRIGVSIRVCLMRYTLRGRKERTVGFYRIYSGQWFSFLDFATQWIDCLEDVEKFSCRRCSRQAPPLTPIQTKLSVVISYCNMILLSVEQLLSN